MPALWDAWYRPHRWGLANPCRIRRSASGEAALADYACGMPQGPSPAAEAAPRPPPPPSPPLVGPPLVTAARPRSWTGWALYDIGFASTVTLRAAPSSSR